MWCEVNACSEKGTEVLNFSYGIRWENRVCVPVVNGDSVGLCFLPSVRPWTVTVL